MSSDRTEKATPKRREEAREKGQLARSAKIPAAAGLLAVFAMLRITGEQWVGRAGQLITTIVARAADERPLTSSDVEQLLLEGSWTLVWLVLPVMLAALMAGLAGSLIQGGFTFTPNALIVRGERFNPISNLKRVFSSQTIVDTVKNLFELSVLVLACQGPIMRAIAELPQLVGLPARPLLMTLGALSYQLGLRVVGVLVLFAGIDYAYKWYAHEKSLRMTKQEIKEEFRRQEGDPMIKQQRRRAAQALRQRRSIAEVPQADVIITNPTHFAVALRYDREKSPSPMVIAKGADRVALRIREIARSHDIMIIENPPLARSLYRAVEPGQQIPTEFFRAVAEILAFVYRQRQNQRF